MQIFAISAAGIVGVLARYYMSIGATRLLGPSFPYGTVAINILGSFLIGVVYVLGIERFAFNETVRVALMVGLLGGFTTYSSFALETVRLFEGGQWGLAFANVMISLVFGLLATVAGLWIARAYLG